MEDSSVYGYGLRDTCQGDSGGPIFADGKLEVSHTPYWHKYLAQQRLSSQKKDGERRSVLVGVVSRGPPVCGVMAKFASIQGAKILISRKK